LRLLSLSLLIRLRLSQLVLLEELKILVRKNVKRMSQIGTVIAAQRKRRVKAGILWLLNRSALNGLEGELGFRKFFASSQRRFSYSRSCGHGTKESLPGRALWRFLAEGVAAAEGEFAAESLEHSCHSRAVGSFELKKRG